MHIDLHTHTTASDGMLTPAQLIHCAREHGVRVLAITDHDSVAAFDDLDGVEAGLTLIPGIEWSCRWRRLEIHIVGLRIRPHDPQLQAAIAGQQRVRRERAGRIAGKLEQLGVTEPLAGAERQAGKRTVGRPHFARHMVASGFVRDVSQAFSKYLGAGKPAHCRTEWPAMQQAIAWTHAAGGVAVLAHPAAYKLTRTRLEELLTDFRTAGGDAMEVVSGQQTRQITDQLSGLCRRHGLLASCGSDYHRSGPGLAEPGAFLDLPTACRPVWQDWEPAPD